MDIPMVGPVTVDTTMVDLTMVIIVDQIVVTIMELDHQTAEEQNVLVDQDPMDITVDLMGLAQMVTMGDHLGFWLEYWVADPKQKRMIL